MSCFGGKDEQIYLAELTVERLRLTADKYREDFADCPPVVKLKFIDFPVFVIFRRNEVSNSTSAEQPATAQPYDEAEGLSYACGKSCLFVKKPRNLVDEMQSQPLRIGIFRADETYPIAEASISLSGCLCDQVAMAGNDLDHRPKPYELSGNYKIADPGKNHAGSIQIFFRLTLFGTYIISHYQLYEDSFIFNNDYDGELRVTRVKTDEDNESNNDGLKINEGTVLSCNKPHTTTESFPIILKAPAKPLKIDMSSPDFERMLTSAQKLNDKNYRRLVYRAYPNEPTCACSQIASAKKTTKKKQQQQPTSFLGCRSGCTNRCCSSVRQRKDANDRGTSCAHFMPTHCAQCTKNDEVYNGEVCNSKEQRIRMRGGGSGEQLDFLNGRSDFTWYNGRFTIPTLRLEGGGAGEIYPSAGCGKAKGMQRNNFQNDQDFLQWDRINPGFLAANKCNLRYNEDKTHNRPMCSCPDKSHLEAAMKRKGHGVCMKKPCLGTDCLIKAFKDAQDFVDSVGKDFELSGFRMNESPYGRQLQETKEIKKAESKLIPVNKQNEITTNLYNNQNQNVKNSSYNATSGMQAPLPKKTGVVQEGAVTLPDSQAHPTLKPKKKDEKIEKPKETENAPPPIPIFEETPCGEPKCKSRLKKVATEEDNAESNEKVDAMRDKMSALQKVDKKYPAKMKSHAGVHGDRARNSKSNEPRSKPSKANQFIYSFGNSYPTSVYGHKNCNLNRNRVPAHMGWMWNQTDTVGKLKPRTGWRPGAISVHLRDILKEAKDGFLTETRRPRSAPSKTKKGKAQKTMSYTALKKTPIDKEEEMEEETDSPPTLHIHRKGGVYYLTMYPIRPETSEVPRLDEPLNPLQFKIVKSKDSLASSSTASDMEIEFSPPAAVNRQKKKPNVIHVETQVKQQEILNAFKKTESKKKEKDSKTKKDKGKKK